MENTEIQSSVIEVLERLSDSISSINSATESPNGEELSTFQEMACSLHEIATQMSTLNERLHSIDYEISEKLEALTKQIRLLGIGSRTF